MKRFLSESLEEYEESEFRDLDLPQRRIVCNRFYECRFHNCNFNEVTFENCRFVDCEFSVCNLSLVGFRKNCGFVDTRFTGSKMVGINWNEVSWPDIQLASPLQFDECDISSSTFMGLSLREMVVTRCRARDVDFREAVLSHADFTYTDLMKSLFNGTDLTEADFVNATNYSIDVAFNGVFFQCLMVVEPVAHRCEIEVPEAREGKNYVEESGNEE